MTKEEVLQALREVRHPARQDRDIVDLGMVANIELLPDNSEQSDAGGIGGNAPRHNADGEVTTR